MYKLYFFLLCILSPLTIFAGNIDVTATPPSGTYNTPIYITLTPTDFRAKTFYSFKPDGYPGDAFLYTGSILLKHSSPFIYFSFMSTSNESKIKQNDYILEYPSTIHFEDESISGSGKIDVAIVNSGSESINIGFWYVQSESEIVVIPENTMIAPGTTYNVSLNYLGVSSVVLRSPDDDERDILISENIPTNNRMLPLVKKTITVKKVPRKIISIGENPVQGRDIPVVLHTTPEEVLPIIENNSPPPPIAETNTPEIQTSDPLDINQIVKVSANESGQTGINPLYLVFAGALSLGAGIFQWYMKRRQK